MPVLLVIHSDLELKIVTENSSFMNFQIPLVKVNSWWRRLLPAILFVSNSLSSLSSMSFNLSSRTRSFVFAGTVPWSTSSTCSRPFCISENSSLQICVRIFPQSLISKSSSFWLCRATSATAVPAAQNSDSCDRRWMFWVLEIYTWILISDILLSIIVFVVG